MVVFPNKQPTKQPLNSLFGNLQPNPVTTQPITMQGATGGSQLQNSALNYSTIAPPTTHSTSANWNSNQSIPDYGGMTPDIINQILSGYTGGQQYYDPSKDPVYQSMNQLATKQADKAGVATMEEMNARGILNSTVTSDRVGQIKQGASDAVLGSIPGLAANFQNQQSNNQAGMQSLLNSVLGAGQWQQSFGEDNRRYDKGFSLDEAGVTGRYLAPEDQKILQDVLTAKAANEKGGITAEQRAENGRIANEGRQYLASKGYDISGLASNVGYQDALKSSYYIGRDSLPQQEMDLKKTEVMGQNTSTTAQGLIQTVLSMKDKSAKGVGNSKENAKIADEARAKLSAMGFDISGIAGNVGYADAVKNAANLGGPTLGAQRLAFDEQSALIDADLKARGLDLEEVRNGIASFTAQSDADHKAHLQDIGVSEHNSKINTNAAISEALQATSMAEAYAYIQRHGERWADNGVDFRSVMIELERKFKDADGASLDPNNPYAFPTTP